jgi:tetratricopeptide (TPR) repeat protein
VKAGDFQTAGMFYKEKGKHLAAAKAFVAGGHLVDAAQEYNNAGKYADALSQYKEYFQNPRDDRTERQKSAKECFDLLRDESAQKHITDEDKTFLLPRIAKVLEDNKQYDVAGKLYREAGEFLRAGEVLVLAGKLELAAQCMKEGGNPKEAARIGGRFYEKAGRWKEAGMAYAGAEEYALAGECFSKAKEPVRAAEYFEKAHSFARAGNAYAVASKQEKAIAALQKVPESDPDFTVTRGILGRCFYEMHDYEHCAATLENHLLNQRIEKSNMDYFYMLALAHEQLGNLGKSKELLLKLGSVDKSFRDLEKRISSIDSRISLMDSQAGPPITNSDARPASNQMMTMVENSLGQRYVLKEELGRGGMGVVYLAQDKQLDRQVALKFLGSLVDNSEEYRQRFIREARTAAKINHPNIVAIYDISASEGKAYIAMEYVQGRNLYGLIQKDKKLGVRESLNYMAQACSALDAIHASGIVHRDIKPDNLIIAKGGLVKLMDFGLAKQDDNRITKANMIMGTPSYMSPEQAQGKEVDGRADIYALGLVLYEMLTGKVVFLDGDVLTRQIKEMPPKLSELVDEIPSELDDFAHKCIAKNPDDRFQTCDEAVTAIRQIPVT